MIEANLTVTSAVQRSLYFVLNPQRPFLYQLQFDSIASLVAQTVKNPPAMRRTWVQSLGWEDPLEKGTAAHSSILAWRIPRTEEPGRLQPMRLQSQT